MSRYTVRSTEHLTPSILKLTLALENPNQKPLAFLPGQYASISFKHKGRPSSYRCFSIASSPTKQGHIEFGIRVMGKFTHALENILPGDEVQVMGPFGNFVLHPDVPGNLIFCAGGIGITPFMSMLRYINDLKLDNKVTLLLSSRNSKEIPYLEELSVDLYEPNLFKQYKIVTPIGPLTINTFTGSIGSQQIKLKTDELMAFGWFNLKELKAMSANLRGEIVLKQAQDMLAKTAEQG